MKQTDIPVEVLYVQACAISNIPIGSKFYEETITKYPKYFPKEIEHRRKWDSIPQSVKDAYYKEMAETRERLWKDEPKRGGIVSMLNGSDEYQEWKKFFDATYPIEQKAEKELHEKYFSKYGL